MPSGMKWIFWKRMRINFVLSHCYQNFKGENAVISGRKLTHSILIRNPWYTQWEKLLGSNIANLWKDHSSAIANSVSSTDNQDRVMNELRTVPGHNDVINVHGLRQIVKGLKNNKAVGNDGILSKVYKFASEPLLTMMSIFLSSFMLPRTLIHLFIFWSCHYWMQNRKFEQMLTTTGQLQLPQLSPRYLSRSCCRDSPGTCGLQTANFVSSKHMTQKKTYLHSSKQKFLP